MKSIPIVVALVAAGAALTACTPERTFDGALGGASGLVVAGPVGLVAGSVVGATAGPAIASSWGIRGGYHHRRHRRRQGH